MYKFRKLLPPQRSMIAFEAAARLLSFTQAAEELCVTQVAVSRQIKALEDFLEVRLFDRVNRSVRLTAAGREFQKVVTESLGALADTVETFRHGQDSLLVVGTTTAFSAYWLMPRLVRFKSRHPEIDLRFAVDDKCVELKSAGIHVSIRYGQGNWPGLKSEFLCHSEVIPLCSPGYWGGRPVIDDPRVLLDEFLIDFDYVVDSRWSSWFRHFGIDPERDPADVTIDAYTSMVQAAQNGQGIALLSAPLIDDLLKTGSLICPADLPAQRLSGGYYLTVPDKVPPCPALDVFTHWMRCEMGLTS